MRFALLAISLLCLHWSTTAQIDRSLLRKLPVEVPTCEASLYIAHQKIPGFYKAGQTDSISVLLKDRKENCGEEMSLFHTAVILHIAKGSFKMESQDKLLEALIAYKNEQGFLKKQGELMEPPTYQNYYEDWDSVVKSYYGFVKAFAKKVLENREAPGIETDILGFYAGEYGQLLGKLKKGGYGDSKLQEAYHTKVETLIYNEGTSLSVFAGYWMPTENLSAIGDHPEVGFQVSYFKGSYKFGLMLGVRFLDAPQPYRVRQDDSNYVTDNFTGFQIGGEVGRALLKGARHELDVNLGMAYDGITVVAADEEVGRDAVMMECFNLNMGLEYRFYYNLRNYVGLDARYHFLNYHNNINSDMAGNAITLRLSWGFTNSFGRANELKGLGY